MSHITRRLRYSILLAVLASVLAASPTAAATVSDSYSIHGYEYYATSTQGRFSGTATGSSGDTAAWNAVVNHTPLTNEATITGGYANLYTSNLVHVHGTFSGGSVKLASEEPGCGTQTYTVDGTLTKVTRSDSHHKGNGTFTATLTHYRIWIGSCVVYSASVSGVIKLSF
jgi:hypothetical protein